MRTPTLVTHRDGTFRVPPSRRHGMSALWFTILAASASVIVADPVNSPPVAGEQHGQFFQSLNLIDEATLELPPVPAKRAETLPREPHAERPLMPPAGPIAESWVWQLGDPALMLPERGPPPVRPAPPASVWFRILQRATPIALTAVALMALALLMSIVPRR